MPLELKREIDDLEDAQEGHMDVARALLGAGALADRTRDGLLRLAALVCGAAPTQRGGGGGDASSGPR